MTWNEFMAVFGAGFVCGFTLLRWLIERDVKRNGP